MARRKLLSQYAAALSVLGLGALAAAQNAPEPAAGGHDAVKAISVKAIAEVQTRVMRNGGEAAKLVPADRLVPGDEVIYTLEIRNTGATPVARPTVVYRIPEHMRYIENSAVGAGAEVSFSVDDGQSFDRPENLKVAGAAGGSRAATAADYTHLRWQLKHTLKANSVAFAHFRAVVK
jgi:uncharacterized repeat protein (TIGR01451 family)